MKKYFLSTLFILCVLTANAQGNPRLTQLEKTLETMNTTPSYEKRNDYTGLYHEVKCLDIIHQMSVPHELIENVKPITKQTVDSLNKVRFVEMQKKIDTIRTALDEVQKTALESYHYECHHQGIDTIQYAIALTGRNNDSIISQRHRGYGPGVYFSNANESVSMFSFSGEKTVELNYSHRFVTEAFPGQLSNATDYSVMQPFRYEEMEKQLKELLKHKCVKTFPVLWRHNKGYDSIEAHASMDDYVFKSTQWNANGRVGWGEVKGTAYFIPESESNLAKELLGKVNQLALNYVNAHPRNHYWYKKVKTFPYLGTPAHVLEDCRMEIVDPSTGDTYKEYAIFVSRDDLGYYFLSLIIEGEEWIPKGWQKLKTWVDGKKVYRKGQRE